MPKDDINRLFAAPWPRLQAQFYNDLVSTLNGLEVDKQSTKGDFLKYDARISVQNVSVTWGLSNPPGFEDVTDQQLSLAVPLSEAGWSLNISCLLNGSVTASGAGIKLFDYHIVQQPQTVAIRSLRLLANIGAESFSTPMPVLKSLAVKASGLVSLAGFINCDLQLASIDVPRSPDGSLQFVLALDQVAIKAVKNASISGKAILTVTDTGAPGTAAAANETFNLDIDFKGTIEVDGLKLPLTISHTVRLPQTTSNVLGLFQEPKDWGRGRPQPITVIPSWVNFADTASSVESAIQEHAPFGATFDLIFPQGFTPCTPPPHTPLNYYGEDDSAIWTGHYLAAESFRYAAALVSGRLSEQQAAVERANKALDGIETLLSIPQQATANLAGEAGKLVGLPCRAALPIDWQIETVEPLNNPAKADRQKYYDGVQIDSTTWCALGRDSDPPSRDSYTGIMLGLGSAIKFIQDPNVQARAKTLAINVVSYLLAHGWNVPTPAGDPMIVGQNGQVKTNIVTGLIFQFHQQLAFLCVGKAAAPHLFGTQYELAAAAADLLWVPVCGDCLDPVGKYYKFNLDYAALGLLILLDEDETRRPFYLRVFQMLGAAIGHHRNAYFNLWQMIADRELADNQAVGSEEGVTLKQETVYLLYEWLLRPLRVPGPNCSLYRKETPSVVYLTHLDPEKDLGLYTELAASAPDILTTFPLPVHYRPGRDMDFCWQRAPFLSGFSLDKDGKPDYVDVDLGQPEQESPGIDYLLPYYMAAYLRII